jgi:eukaryotic-like serine/threonine-protein kinase
MALTSGTKLGPYEILAPLGAGGMGEVYRAQDTRLDRAVAIKILPSHLSSNAEAKQRLDREARAISSLNHPNICTLYDVGHQDGTDFLVMEYLEGDTLADRLMKGPLPPEQVLKCGVEICEGLEKAHRTGVIHRDLKPGNIMLTKSGAKLMDFGLAKATTGSAAPSSSLTMTISGPSADQPLTARGMVVGTFQYMSPEQVEGKEADARSDIFALGAVLYEMATGKRAFTGKSQANIVAAILASDPQPISTVQPMSPPALDRVVRICLAKDPDERWQTAHDVKLQLQWIAEAGSQAGVPAPVLARRKLSQRAAWMVAALAVAAALAFAIGFFLRAPQPGVAVRSSLLPPKDQMYDAFSFALSPDGKKLAFVAADTQTGKNKLWVRPLNTTSVQELAGTEEAQYPFWSPDSASIGFYAEGKLKRIDAGGGPVVALADAPDGRGASWSSNGVIVFSRMYTGEGLFQVSEVGGPASEVTRFSTERKEDSHRFPFFLPDGRHFMFYMSSSLTPVGSKETDTVAGVYVGDLKTKAYTYLLHADSGAQYGNGYLFYLQQQNLMEQPFDASAARLAGAPVPVAPQVQYNPDRWVGAFSVSARGTLAYMAGEAAVRQLQWFSRDGKPLGTVGPPGVLGHPALSPDGKRVAVTRIPANSSNRDIWIYDLARGNASRLTFNDAEDNVPVWTRDGTRLAYANARSSYDDIYLQSSSGLGGEELLVPSSHESKEPNDWTPNGSSLLYTIFSASTTGVKLWMHDLVPEKKDYPLLKTNSSETEGKFSPDGHWLSYTSEETGRSEIYVVPYPALNGKWQVSTTGGNQARWRKDGKELVFVTSEGKLMSVAISTSGGTLNAEAPKLLFETKIFGVVRDFWQYDMTANAQKFLVNTRIEQAQQPITLYANWPAELHK